MKVTSDVWLSRFYACFEALREHVTDNDSVAHASTTREMGAVLAHVLRGRFQLTCDTDTITLHYVGKLDDVSYVLRHYLSVIYVEDGDGNVTCEKNRFGTRGRFDVPPPIGQKKKKKVTR